MTYKLKFIPAALKEWEKLAPPIRNQFKKKLAEQIEHPKVAADQLRGYESVYKIKLRAASYRLAYGVNDHEIVIYVIAVGRRAKDEVYQKLRDRL